LLNIQQLKDLLQDPDISNRDKILLILAVEIEKPKKITEIKEIAKVSGFRTIDKLNVSDYLIKSKGMAICTTYGWELTTSGKKYLVKERKIDTAAKIITQTATSLRTYISSITDPDTTNFLNEAVSCFENKSYRAAVVLSWVGAMSLLQNYVIDKYLAPFNTEASRRDSRWKPAKTTDDLSRMKESEFLNIIAYLSIIGPNMKQELDKCLNLRNSCGHPNSLVIAENTVAAHIEILILNVFTKF